MPGIEFTRVTRGLVPYAVDRAGLTADDLANPWGAEFSSRRSVRDRVRSLATEEVSPTLAELRRLSKFLSRPLLFFFLPSIPMEQEIAGFR